MRYFIVTVHPMRVTVHEQVSEVKNYDAIATVDGDTWRYKIQKSDNLLKNDRTWRGRAYHHIHYHAHNSGTVVRFKPVHQQTRRKRKIHEKQLSLPM